MPLLAFPLSVQTGVPVEQAIDPVLHGLVGWQVAPAVHALQVPLSQTLLVPQEVPLATFPVSLQTEVPVAQDVAPFLHGLVGWQALPAVHELQVPLSQTLLVPQAVPSATLPVSAQTEVPVTQEVVPVRQALLG